MVLSLSSFFAAVVEKYCLLPNIKHLTLQHYKSPPENQSGGLFKKDG
jgi:hypothetical protein